MVGTREAGAKTCNVCSEEGNAIRESEVALACRRFIVTISKFLLHFKEAAYILFRFSGNVYVASAQR